VTALQWQRPAFNQARTRYHIIHNGQGLCGTRPTAGLTRPRVLTARQIETQACRVCVAKTDGEQAGRCDSLVRLAPRTRRSSVGLGLRQRPRRQHAPRQPLQQGEQLTWHPSP
jgi:hypothetical protein